MSFWFVGDEEADDPRFLEAGMAASWLYTAAGSWCMREVRGRRNPLPAEWFIPTRWVRTWPNGARLAGRLVRVGLWERVADGYCFAWIRDQNKPDALRQQRKHEREKKRAQRACPQGTYRGDNGPNQELKKVL
jgi:hypothetical protein